MLPASTCCRSVRGRSAGGEHVTQLDATAELTPVAFAAGAGGIRRAGTRCGTGSDQAGAALAAGRGCAVRRDGGTGRAERHGLVHGYARIVDIAHQLQIGAHLASEGRAIPALVDSSAEEVGKTLRSAIPAAGSPRSPRPSRLTGTDASWMYQPFLAITAAVIGLGVYAAGGLVPSRTLRALASAIAAGKRAVRVRRPGGCKELAAAAHRARGRPGLRAPHRGRARRGLVLIGVVLAGCFSVLSLGVAPGWPCWSWRTQRCWRPAPRPTATSALRSPPEPWRLQRSRSPP